MVAKFDPNMHVSHLAGLAVAVAVRPSALQHPLHLQRGQRVGSSADVGQVILRTRKEARSRLQRRPAAGGAGGGSGGGCSGRQVPRVEVLQHVINCLMPAVGGLQGAWQQQASSKFHEPAEQTCR